MVFAEEVFGGAVPKQFFPPTEAGLRDCMNHGVLAGYKVVGVKATLYDGSYHPVDSKENAFKEAARLAYNAAMPNAKPTLLEPIGKVTIVAPEDYTGTLMGDITKRRGIIIDMTTNDHGDQVIQAEVPLAEMLTYATELRAMTQGRGSYVSKFDRYQPAPKEVADKVIEKSKNMNIDEKNKKFIADFYKYAFVGLVQEWIENGMEENPEEIINKLSLMLDGNFDNAIKRLSF